MTALGTTRATGGVLCLALCAAAASVAPATAAPGDRSPDGIWIEVDRAALGDTTAPLPRVFRAYRLDFEALQKVLAAAPREQLERRRPPASSDAASLYLPMVDGTYAQVAVEESPVLGPSLSAQYPDIRTFAMHGIEDRRVEGRLTLDPSGFQAILRPPSDLARVTKLVTGEGTFYLAYLNRDRTDGADDFRLVHDEPRGGEPEPPRLHDTEEGHHAGELSAMQFQALGFQSGPTLRQFRLVVATTGEYYQGRDAGNGNADVVASIVAEINNANAVFDQELAVRLSLDWVILYSDPDTDPYAANATACQLRDANPGVVNAVLTLADYDIGFVFGQGGGNGCAWYVVCLNDKARGAGLINTMNVPAGGSTGLLLHEMGHQLGGRHTFSSGAAGCTAVEFNPGSAYEPGSGSTIMSYLGNCSPDNVDTSVVGAGQYYHTLSFDQIIDNITNVATCGASLGTGNSAPAVNAGGDYTIPRGTPFTLTGSGSDPDGDALTFNWEQFDGAANQRPINTDTGEGPIFRSVPPASEASRTFPNLQDLLSNTVRNGEILPSTDRSLTFRLVARDNFVGGGGVSYDDAVITVQGDPFAITSPNGGEVVGAGCALPVTWTVGGGSVANFVDLGISDDGGNSFGPLLGLAANTGSADTLAPCGATADARVKASAVGNVFFDVSNNDFSIVQTPPAVAVTAQGGAVDQACQFTVTFSATVEDDCGIPAANVSAQAIKGSNNYTLGPIQFNAQQVDGTTVGVSGSVLVSDLTSSPALLTIKVDGADACGAAASDTAQVQIVDATPPAIDVAVDPSVLWAPNHSMSSVHATVTATDNCPGVAFVLTSVTSSEPENSLGDGNTAPDIQDAAVGTADVDVSLRAERSGGGPGRTYTLVYTATDGSNNSTQDAAVVVVPKSQK